MFLLFYRVLRVFYVCIVLLHCEIKYSIEMKNIMASNKVNVN